MKVCAAMCIFNSIGHATIALAYANMGINFALYHSSDFQFCSDGLGKKTRVNYKRVARTLVTLRGWMMSTLGYVLRDGPEHRVAFSWLADQKDLTPNEVIQQELAKVVEIEANFLRTIDCFGNISAPIFGSIRTDLTQWHRQIPQWMHFNALVESSTLSTETRRTVFLVHLFYLSAIILVARLAHGGPNSSPPRYDIEEVRIAASDGVVAARVASRILQLQLDEQSVFQRCWLCEFTSYMSCITLLHGAVQLLIHGHPQDVWQKELSHAKSCLDVLLYCGKVDEIALHFAEVTQGYYNKLKAQAGQDRELPVVDMPEKFDYLFAVPESSPADLREISRNLLTLVSCPFGSPSNLHTEGTLKAGIGAYQAWNSFFSLPFNKTATDAVDELPLLGTALSGMHSGQFVGSSRPHGWDWHKTPNNL